MRKPNIWLTGAIALSCLLALVMTTLLVTVNSPAGRDLLIAQLGPLTANRLTVSGVTGEFPGNFQTAHIQWQDDQGVVRLDNVHLSWQPWLLWQRRIAVDELSAERFHIISAPHPPDTTSTSLPWPLPFALQLNRLHIGTLEVSPTNGRHIALSADGHASLSPNGQGEWALTAKSAQGQGHYQLTGQLSDAGLHVHLDLQEPSPSALAAWAGITNSQPLAINAQLDGPPAALQTKLDARWGLLTATLSGLVNANDFSAALQFSAHAPAMQAHTELAWHSLDLQGKLNGVLSQPNTDSQLSLQGLQSHGHHFATMNLHIQGEGGQLKAAGKLSRWQPPGHNTDALEAKPLTLNAELGLGQPTQPLTFALKHQDWQVSGAASLAAPRQAQIDLAASELKPWAALLGTALSGQANLRITAQETPDQTAVNLQGQVTLAKTATSWQRWLGGRTEFSAGLALSPSQLTLTQAQLRGPALNLAAHGELASQQLNLNWQLDSDTWAALFGGQGQLHAQGQIHGPVTDLAANAEVTGDWALAKQPRQPLTARLSAAHLPQQSEGQIALQTTLAGAPLQLAANFKRQPDHAWLISLQQAGWRKLHGQGEWRLPAQQSWPEGKLMVTAAHLEELQVWHHLPLTGSAEAEIQTTAADKATVTINARQLGWGNRATLTAAHLAATVTHPLHQPRWSGRLDYQGLGLANAKGSGQIQLDGDLSTLDWQWDGTFDQAGGQPLAVAGAGTFSGANLNLAVQRFSADWQNQPVRLLSPTQVNLADGLAVQQFRLAIGHSVLKLDGQLHPELATEIALENCPLALVKLFWPPIDLTGTLSITGQLHGTGTAPQGRLAVHGEQVRWQPQTWPSLPSTNLQATLDLDGQTAQVNGQLQTPGQTAQLAISGRMPLQSDGLLDLHSHGNLNLKLFDPLLTAEGRRARGQIQWESSLAGTWTQPQLAGTLRVTKAEVRDYTIGTNLTAINGLLKAQGGRVQVETLDAQAGSGTVHVQGELEMLKPGIPINLKLTARNAKPLASDRLTAVLNADLTARGQILDEVLVLGAINVSRADIRIPEYLPTSIAVLKIETPDQPVLSNTATATNSHLKLNLIIAAPGEVFVRGRGVDAELGGSVAVRGTLTQLQGSGGFLLRRGRYTLGGKSLAFTEGKVGFANGSLTDPSIDLTAETRSNNITATLNLSGSAYQPKIRLSSSPTLPQDEILARLLFNRSASSLSVLEILQIGSALAMLSGATTGLGDPLDDVRKTLGLDRLSVGGQKTALEAGSYLTPGVYLGTRQGLSGGPQAMIQIDVTKNIKLEAAVGANAAANKHANPNSLGVIYQFEY